MRKLKTINPQSDQLAINKTFTIDNRSNMMTLITRTMECYCKSNETNKFNSGKSSFKSAYYLFLFIIAMGVRGGQQVLPHLAFRKSISRPLMNISTE